MSEVQPKPKRKTLLLILAVIGGLLLLCIIVAILVGTPDNKAVSDTPSQPGAGAVEQPATPTPEPATPAPEPIALTPAELRTKWDELTEVQQKNYVQTLAGQRVRWTCPVFQVRSGGAMTLDCESGGTFTAIMVHLTIPEKDALRYNKGQMVTFEGKIGKLSTFLLFTVDINDAVIIE